VAVIYVDLGPALSSSVLVILSDLSKNLPEEYFEGQLVKDRGSERRWEAF
jgi:hypothetical protein